jgi:hypothetical protein
LLLLIFQSSSSDAVLSDSLTHSFNDATNVGHVFYIYAERDSVKTITPELDGTPFLFALMPVFLLLL